MASTAMDVTPTISPLQITTHYISTSDLPSSPTDTSSPSPTTDKPKRKRKSWGQPIPDYEPILPPGKRAKTDEEKEQRRCERIVRNRKAAATSRDRKKQEFDRLEKENKLLRDQLERQSELIKALQAGQDPATLPSLVPTADPVSFNTNLPPTPAMSAKDSQAGRRSGRASSPVGSVVSLSNTKRTSPTLTPSLFIKSETSDPESPFSQSTPQSLDSNLPDFDTLETLPCGSELEELINSTIDDPQRMLQQFTNFDDSVSAGSVEVGDKRQQQQMDQQHTHHSIGGTERHVQYLIQEDALGNVPDLDFLGTSLATSTVVPQDAGHDLSFDTFIDYPAFDGDFISSSLQDGLSAQTSV